MTRYRKLADIPTPVLTEQDLGYARHYLIREAVTDLAEALGFVTYTGRDRRADNRHPERAITRPPLEATA